MQQFIFKYNNHCKIYYYIFSILVFSSCKKLIQIPLPQDRLVTSSVFASSSTANQAMISIYGNMAFGGASYYMSQNCGLLADEFDNYNTNSLQIDFYMNAMSSSMSVYDGCWGSAYNYIYQANAVIEGMQNNSSIPSVVVKRLTGEAKFIRAFWHFYLTLCYGDVPIAITTSYSVNTNLKRSARTDVFKQIITDLKDAGSLLSGDFLDATDTSVTSDRLRPTTWAAHALLARAYLYNGNYDNAETEATAIINNNILFDLDDDLNGVFLANSREAIWQNAYPSPDEVNTRDGYYFVLTGPSSDPAGQTIAISKNLLDAFEIGDSRKDNWISGTSTIPVYYFPYKYKVQVSADPSVHTENVMVLRLAEQYLIRAEARAQLNNISGAIDDINIIRHRAGLGDYSGVQNQTSVLAAILHERQVELFSEWGHRWFDLARTGNINAVMDTITPMKGGTWDPSGYQQLFPIPQQERILNSNLTQNQGYN